jgi:large subunit ribosomal protein L22
MTGPKTNERPGTRAQVKYSRVSAYKAREILDLIRDKSYGEATDILKFSERSVSNTILKCLDSAVANAEHNDGLAAEELYVAACYADEGPTLKRWRPRARGRATRIRKRTCHITVIVARYSDEALEILQARQRVGGSSAQAASARRERVERSRAAAAAAAEEEHDHDHDHIEVDEDAVVDEVVDSTIAAVSEDTVEDAEDTVEDAEDTVEDAEDTVEDAEDTVEDAEDRVEDAEDTVEDAEDTVEDAEDTVEEATDDADVEASADDGDEDEKTEGDS